MDKADEQKRINQLYADNKAAFEAAQASAGKGDWQYFEKVPMDKAEQPTTQALKPCPEAEAIAQGIADRSRWKKTTDNYARIYQAAYAGAIAALNTRTTSLAAQDGLVAEIERQEGLVKTYRGAQLRAEEKLCREQANAQGWKRRAEILESKLAALSAIKEKHHD